MNEVLVVLRPIAALGAGLVGGLMFAFSFSVLPGLAKLPAPQGIEAMRRMNTALLNPLFGLIFGGTTLLCLALAVGTPIVGGSVSVVVGSLAYLLGVIAVTFVVNVPMNNVLDTLDVAAEDSEAYWQRYLSRWTTWNHGRFVAGAAACVLLTVG